ncbi:hypothetical protein CEXT_772121 [Caerostris extrusa]|uniref:Uncharacterized protein n=1 Tax=Caerostris extrusa TaxID=172846 RepID=A0AAV4XJ21_CAEEX|nr:hypothetical protein CEXT_772121 [Caerostris extrusa]
MDDPPDARNRKKKGAFELEGRRISLLKSFRGLKNEEKSITQSSIFLRMRTLHSKSPSAAKDRAFHVAQGILRAPCFHGYIKSKCYHHPRFYLFRSSGFLLETVHYVPFDAGENKRRIRTLNAKPEAPFRSFQTQSMKAPLIGLEKENSKDETSPSSYPEIVERNARWKGTQGEGPPINTQIHPIHPERAPPSFFFSLVANSSKHFRSTNVPWKRDSLQQRCRVEKQCTQ